MKIYYTNVTSHGITQSEIIKNNKNTVTGYPEHESLKILSLLTKIDK